MLRRSPLFVALMLGVFAAQAPAESPHQDVMEFLGPHGCTLGPKSRAAALAAGFETAEIDAARAWAEANGHASLQRDWIVFAAEICQITLPKFAPEVTLQDPDIQRDIYKITQADVDAHAHEEYPLYITEDIGCFLGDVPRDLASRPGWDRERAYRAYLELFGAGLTSGALRFHTTDLLRTPPGVRVMTGDCAKVPFGPDIEQNHALLVKEFSNYVRYRFANVSCDGSEFPAVFEFMNALGARNTGAMLHLEYDFIAMAAGWTTATSALERGDMRPPMCHYTPPN